jgi:hypothetical protein
VRREAVLIGARRTRRGGDGRRGARARARARAWRA